MHLARCYIQMIGVVSLWSYLVIPFLFPFAKLTFFAPFLIVVYYQTTYLQSLWLSILCGLLIDCYSVHAFFGLNALGYCVTTVFLYPQKKFFFVDRLTTLPFMTFLFSISITGLFLLFAWILESKSLFFWNLFYADLVLMPIFDALYSFLIFVLPSFCLKRIRIKR